MNVLALCHDMIFRTKIESTARALGATVLNNAASLEAGGGIVFIDLDSAWPEAEYMIASLRQHSNVRFVAFGSHVRQDRFEQARAAGIKEVMARSAFVSKLPSMLSMPAS